MVLMKNERDMRSMRIENLTLGAARYLASWHQGHGMNTLVAPWLVNKDSRVVEMKGRYRLDIWERSPIWGFWGHKRR